MINNCAQCRQPDLKGLHTCGIDSVGLAGQMARGAYLRESPPPKPSDELQKLRDEVEVLRLQAEIRKLKADAAPKPEETGEEMLARAQREAQHRHDIMFAATATKPKLRAIK